MAASNKNLTLRTTESFAKSLGQSLYHRAAYGLRRVRSIDRDHELILTGEQSVCLGNALVKIRSGPLDTISLRSAFCTSRFAHRDRQIDEYGDIRPQPGSRECVQPLHFFQFET